MSAPLSAQPPAAGHDATSVLSWNQFAVSFIVATEHKLQPESYVYLAYVQGAVYDAVTAVDGGAEAYLPGLAHHPHAFDPAAAAGLPLTLAGHTHGGQIMLTDHIGAGPMRFRYWAGEYRKRV